MPNDVGQIPQDVVAEGGKVSKKVFEGLGETIGTVGAQLTGKKPKKQTDPVAELTERDEEFKKRAVSEILARLRKIKEEEAKLSQQRQQKEKDWQVAQREKLAPPPQIERQAQKTGQKLRQPQALPQVAKQRVETKVGWGAG